MQNKSKKIGCKKGAQKVNNEYGEKNYFDSFFPMGDVYHWAKFFQAMEEKRFSDYYVKKSIISYFPGSVLYKILTTGGGKTISQGDLLLIDSLLNNTGERFSIPAKNLIIVLVESLESWPIDRICDFDYMPNLKTISENEHVLFCNMVKSQTSYGNSGDGQMIVMSGLLPISSGAACCLYDDNVYPNFAHFYSESAIVNPTPGVWHQTKMTENYQIKHLIEPNENNVWNDDRGVVCQMIDYIEHAETTFCVLGITISSHGPFEYGREHVVHAEKGMPQGMSNYLNTLYYTDSCIGILWNYFQESGLAENSVLVVTGDHTIFRTSSSASGFDFFAEANDINMRCGETYTPLLVYTPDIVSNIKIDQEVYQMDIYPTILSAIGCNGWKGLGINLLDSVSIENREIEEDVALRLSDELIRNNYFSSAW